MHKYQITLIFILLICSISFVQGQSKGSELKSNDKIEWETFTQNNFSIEYLSEWRLDTTSQKGASFFLFSERSSKEDKFSENINLVIQDLSGYDISMDQFVELSENQIKTLITNGKIVSSQRIKGEDLDYHRLSYTGTQGIFELMFVQHFWLVDNSAYVLTLTSEVDQYDNYKDVGNKMLNSFEINEARTDLFKTVKQASYSVKRSGLLSRERALVDYVESMKEFNDRGKLAKLVQYETDGSIYELTKLTWNDSDIVTQREVYSPTNQLIRRGSATINEQGHISAYTGYNSDDEIISIQSNEYDEKGNVVKMTNESLLYGNVFIHNYIYNTDNLIMEEVKFNKAQNKKDKRTYTYDEKGNEIEQFHTRSNGEITKFVSEYNDSDDLVSNKWFNVDGEQINVTSFEYLYDTKGNWITKKRSTDGELSYVWEREIKYK